MKTNMKKTASILILILTLFSGKAAAQCIGDLTANISPGSMAVCYNTSPGTFTATGGGESGSYTYLWYKNGVSTGITTQTYSPGNLIANTTVYCAISSGICGPKNTPTVSITVEAYPTAPGIGTIVQPSCFTSTGSVVLNGLPTGFDWLITIFPGGATQSGNGSSATINNLSAGNYTFKVTNYAGCQSPASNNAVIQAQPQTPTAPAVGTITAPTCPSPTGSVVLSGLPTPGTWTLTRLPNITTTGSGSSYTVNGLAPGVYFYTVTNQAGCTSPPSSDVTIPSPPAAPSAPVIGTITQPTCAVATGSVALSGLPGAGTWIVTVNPLGSTFTGSGTTTTISSLGAGTYTFTVTNSVGCTSVPSLNAVINTQPLTPSAPVNGGITQPTCALATGSVILNSLPSGTWLLTRNPGSVTTISNTSSYTVSGLAPGTYSFTVTTNGGSGCTSLPLSNVVINSPPSPPSAPLSTVDCALGFNHAVINVTSPLGANLQYSLNGGLYQDSAIFREIANGSYFIAVRSDGVCTTVGTIFTVSCGCINAPTVVLSSSAGSTCGTTPVTVAANTFGGSATSVTITTNGTGSVDQSTISVSPFVFTYTPAAGDMDKTVIITVTTNNPLGSPCLAGVATYTLAVNALPSPPSIGAVTDVTCTGTNGTVILTGLPATGTWTLTRLPDNVVTSGTTTTTTVTDLAARTYTFTVASTAACISAESAQVVISPPPSPPTAPVIDSIIQPTCSTSTGTVILSGLPASGSYTLTRLPSGVQVVGSGATYSVPGVPGGTYTFTVNAAGCISAPSASLTVNAAPTTPTTPTIGRITQPSCTHSTGSVILLGLPPTGTWTVTRIPGNVNTTGTGISDTITALPAGGTYNFTVKNQSNCVSPVSANVVISAQPPKPSAPVVGNITQPTYALPSGSVELSGLPAPPANWKLTRLPDMVTTENSGTSYTATGLPGGLYFYTVTNSVGCVSNSSAEVRISTLGPPDLIITDPPAVCSPALVDLTAPGVTEGSTGGLIFSYWTDADTTTKYPTPEAAVGGTYYIKGRTVSGYYNIKPVNAIVFEKPVPNAGPDQSLFYQYNTAMAAVLGENESGIWSVSSGKGVFADVTNPGSEVSNLAKGDNIMLWIVTKGVCPADSDKVTISVEDISYPTLITPNGDTNNEYFVILGLSNLGKSELVVFDRRGAEIFRNSNYDNKWNGVDYNEKPLPNDTYFFVLNSSKRVVKGYIVIRR
jgi:gliding motility-associated-like protein